MKSAKDAGRKRNIRNFRTIGKGIDDTDARRNAGKKTKGSDRLWLTRFGEEQRGGAGMSHGRIVGNRAGVEATLAG